MATFTVNSFNDGAVNHADDATNLTLRDAIDLAQNAAGDDAIVFQSGHIGTVTLTSGALNIFSGNNVSISGDTNGDGNIDITISGGFVNATSHHITISEDAKVELDALSFTGGYGSVADGVNAGSIVNSGNLSIVGSSFNNNIAFDGSNVASTSNASPQAGAILNLGTGVLSITESQFLSNFATSEIGINGADGYQGYYGAYTGSAAGHILNMGGLSLDRVLMVGGHAQSGNGGDGGFSTGSYEIGSHTYFIPGGDGGKSGYAAGNILNISNFGLNTFSGTVQSSAGFAISGSGGNGGGSAGGISYNGQNGPVGQSNADILNLGIGSVTQVSNLGTFLSDTVSVGYFQSFHGLSGNDILTASQYSSMYGGAGNDTLTGVANSSAFGGIGNDTIINNQIGGGGTWDGGAGIDTLDVSANTVANKTFNLNAASFTIDGATFSNFENLIGTQSNDIIIGSNSVNVLNGQDGNDKLRGGAGADTLNGGAGVHDIADYTGSNAAVLVSLAGTTPETGGHAAGDTLLGIEDVTGSAHDDSLTGNGLANILIGNGGADILNGGVGADTLKGATGADRLNGGTGDDALNGGADADIFIYNIAALWNHDTITGWQNGIDKIDLFGAGFDFADFTETQVGADTLLTLTTNTAHSIRLIGINATTIDAADFM